MTHSNKRLLGRSIHYHRSWRRKVWYSGVELEIGSDCDKRRRSQPQSPVTFINTGEEKVITPRSPLHLDIPPRTKAGRTHWSGYIHRSYSVPFLCIPLFTFPSIYRKTWKDGCVWQGGESAGGGPCSRLDVFADVPERALTS